MKPAVLVALLLTAAAPAPPAIYSLVKSVPLGAPDRWDYVVYDDRTNRVYVAHGDRLAVVDARTGSLVGEVQGISGGTHGTAVAAGQGFTDDGRNGKAVAFDLRTLKVTHEIPAAADADGIAYDRATGHLFVIEGDPQTITVIDAKSDAPVATISGGEGLEYAAPGRPGEIFVAGEGNGDLIKIDARSNKVVGRWNAAGCTSPHGLAVNVPAERVFMGCANSVMAVLDGRSGRLVATLPIGRGNDAVAFDPVRKRVFSSNGRDGTITGYQELSPDRYVPLPVIPTVVSARTMSLDPRSGRLFVAGADTDPDPAGGRPHVRPGTLRLMIFQPRS